MAKIPKLSVAIRVYNQEKEVIRALDSVVSQTFDELIELVLAVDLSVDNSLAVVQDYCARLNGRRFVYQIIAHSSRQGGTRNLITALAACTGDYIAILDADDFWIDNEKSRKQVAIMESDPGIGLVYGDFIIESDSLSGGKTIIHRPEPSENAFTQLLLGNFIGTLVSMFRRSLLEFVDFSVLEDRGWSQDDYFLWLEMANHTRLFHLDDLLAVYSITRDINSERIPYEACAYDVTTTEVKEYYIKKYPRNTTLTVADVWDAHYQLQFRAARFVRDYRFAIEAIKSMSPSIRGRQKMLYGLCRWRLFWLLYIRYYHIKHKEGELKRYFL